MLSYMKQPSRVRVYPFVRSLSNISKITKVPNTFDEKRSAYKPKVKPVKGLVFHPSPAAPSGSSTTPDAFLPKDDPRKGLHWFAEKINIENAPPLSEIKEKVYNLTPKEAEEIKKLRTQDASTWTPKKLAEKYGCSEFAIRLIADSPKQRKEEMQRRLSIIKSSWGKNRKTAKSEFQKVKKLWYRDE